LESACGIKPCSFLPLPVLPLPNAKGNNGGNPGIPEELEEELDELLELELLDELELLELEDEELLDELEDELLGELMEEALEDELEELLEDGLLIELIDDKLLYEDGVLIELIEEDETVDALAGINAPTLAEVEEAPVGAKTANAKLETDEGVDCAAAEVAYTTLPPSQFIP
jgi:hypothetical protein